MQLFIQNINELENIDDLIENLSDYRKEYFFKLRQEKDKLACLASDYLIKKNVSTDSVLKNEYGKPYIKNAPYFNLSHSGDYVVLAVSDMPIGIDIEEIKPIEVEEIAQRAFNEKEIEQLHTSNYDLKTFYKIWTIKESYLKKLGYGFSLEPKSFCVDLKTLKIDNTTQAEIIEKIDGYIIATT